MQNLYRGLCDASAAVMLDGTTFVVADDEHNHLHYYRLGQETELGTLDLAGFLGTARGKESDLEGAARIGHRTWWIGSHSRNPDGEEKRKRHRLFALDLAQTRDGPRLVFAGTPFRGLLAELIAADKTWGFGLEQASQLAAEAEGGLNIEGLAAGLDGSLLIGFRNPLVQGKALIVPLLNPDELIFEANEEPGLARFGAPILADLGGRGIRDLDRYGDCTLAVAGPTADEGDFRLYRLPDAAPAPPLDIGLELDPDLHPEVVFVIPDTNHAVILSDDGKRDMGGTSCQDLAPEERCFRSITVDLPA